MQVVLVMFRSDGERRSFSLPRDVTVIGRREDCDLRIPLGEVSRKHCRFVIEDDELRLEDLGSSNGTFHNGQRVQEAVVQAGDTVQVGPVIFVVQVDGVPTDEEIQPAPAEAAPAAISPGNGSPAGRTGSPSSEDDFAAMVEGGGNADDSAIIDIDLEELEDEPNKNQA